MDDRVADVRPEPQAGVVVDEVCELTIHVAFDGRPVVAETTDSKGELTVQYGPPFLRFPVQLSAKDARILEHIFDTTSIVLVGFEIKNGDGSPRAYRTLSRASY